MCRVEHCRLQIADCRLDRALRLQSAICNLQPAIPQLIFTLVLLALAACGAAATDDPAAAGRRLFTIQCAGCHAASAAAGEALGPSLPSMAARAAASPDPAAWLRLAITDPNAELAPGHQPGLMPSGYAQSLTAAELDALVSYLLAPAEH